MPGRLLHDSKTQALGADEEIHTRRCTSASQSTD